MIKELIEDKLEKIECLNCQREIEQDEQITIQVSRQTHWEPAEYEDYCDYCISNKYKRKFPNKY